MATSHYELFGFEPFPTVKNGDSIARLIATEFGSQTLQDGDVVVIASKVVSIEEHRSVDLRTVLPSPEAERIGATTGKDARIIELILQESLSHRLATERGPIIAMHRLGYELTSAGIDKGNGDSAYLIPKDPDASARRIRDQLAAAIGVEVAVIIVDSDGRSDREGAVVLAIGAAGIAPLRLTPKPGTVKMQGETLVDMLAGAAGVILGQRGRGVPVVAIRGVQFEWSDQGVQSILHARHART